MNANCRPNAKLHKMIQINYRNFDVIVPSVSMSTIYTDLYEFTCTSYF